MKLMSRGLGLLLVGIYAITLLSPAAVQAKVPYYTYTNDNYNRVVAIQPAYYPLKVLAHDLYDGAGDERAFSPLKEPQDVFIDSRNEIYIADTGNNRIVHLSKDGKLIRMLQPKENGFDKPNGLFVTPSGDIYVADTGNNRIVKLNQAGEVIDAYGKPESRLLPASFQFDPISIVVDKRGFLYIAVRGAYQGLLQLDPQGSFFGFFGTNRTPVTLMDILKRSLYSEDQLLRQEKVLPSTIRTVEMDRTGFIYTTSVGADLGQLKKFNIAGDNRWEGLPFGESSDRFQSNGEKGSQSNLIDLTVDEFGNVTTIDRNFKVIYQYDSQGNLLFYWSGPVTAGMPQLGILQSPSAMATNSEGDLFILDDQQNMLTVFRPTEFGRLVHAAVALLQDGKYEESVEVWQRILKLNAHFSPAYEGLSKAAYYHGDYEQAREFARLAGNPEQFSESFWQIRLHWIQDNFSQLANGLIIIAVLGLVTSRIGRKKEWSLNRVSKARWLSNALLKQLKQAFVVLKHPLDGFNDLRYLNKGSYLSAGLILVAVMTSIVLKAHLTSFTFIPRELKPVSIQSILVPFAAIWLTWVVCNYLISSIYRGEGRFKDVFMGSAYALMPVALLGVPIALLSNVMTLNEISIYGFLIAAMFIWCGLLLFWMVQSLQNYSVGETLANISFTLFAMVMLAVLAFIIFGLASEFLNFVYSVYKEVSM